MTWYDAERACGDYGGHVTSILNNFENVYLAGLADSNLGTNTDFWIGALNNYGYGYGTAGPWKWSDGNNISYTDWDASNFKMLEKIVDLEQPPSYSFYCGYFVKNNSKWSTTDCSFFSAKAYICKIPINKPKCSDLWTYFDYTKSCYKVKNFYGREDVSELFDQLFFSNSI